MIQLFMLECKKIVTSVIYWLFVISIAIVFWFNYGNVDKEEISDADSPSSIFYCARDDQYAKEKDDLSEESGQNRMMLGLTRRLLTCYRNNSYEYYPFGYIKEKVFSKSEQNIVLGYLQEITGLDKASILKNTGEVILKESKESEKSETLNDSVRSKNVKESPDVSGIDISGKGAYVAEPGTGNMNEAGKYEFQPNEWEYVENPSISDGKKEGILFGEQNDSKASTKDLDDESAEDFSIQVPFQRFMEIMDEISGMIGKNSYFSEALINLYYGENDMEDSAVTLKQHEEFYNKDKITGAFARYYCDSIALAALLFPAIVIIAVMVKDGQSKMMESIYTKQVSSFKLIFIRYFASVGMMFLPVLLLPLKSIIVLAKYANASGHDIDILAFPKYIAGWILPTLMFVTALGLLLSVLIRSYVSVFVMGIFWMFFKPSVGKIAGGNYELFDLAIRHNTLKGFGRMMQHFDMLVINRIIITCISFLFVFFSIWIYQAKRRGGLNFHVQKFIRYHKREL